MAARPRRRVVESERPRATRSLEVIAGEAASNVPSLDGVIHERARLAIVRASRRFSKNSGRISPM